MEKFLTGTKRKSSALQADLAPDDDCESTDVKLAMLASLHPNISQEALLETLLAYDGSVNDASSSLVDGQASTSPKKPRTLAVVGAQASLRSFASPSAGDASGNGGREYYDRPSSVSPKKPRLLSRKGTTLHLYDPADVAEHTPCSIIHNFLPRELADDLLREMLEESRTFEKITFKLFDNVVSSPHTSAFYVGTQAELDAQKHDYYYNGGKLTVGCDAPIYGRLTEEERGKSLMVNG